MPIFLDQSLRKALLSKIRDSLGHDEILSGKVKVLDQESFLPETENQIILTDIQVTNESLDASNRITELRGTVTFAPIKRPDTSFLFWAQENPQQTQLIDQGFYHLKLGRTSEQLSGDTPDQGWTLTAEVIKRVTSSRNQWVGLKIFLDAMFPTPESIDPKLIQVFQDSVEIIIDDDYQIVSTDLILRKYVQNTTISYNGVDITDSCYYCNLFSEEFNLRAVNPPIQLRPPVLLDTVSVYNVTLGRPLVSGFTVTHGGMLYWKHPVFRGTRVLIQYYERKPLRNWSIPSEFTIELENTPLVYSSGVQAISIISSLRGPLSTSMYTISGHTLSILEPVPNESITLDYRYHQNSLGPFAVSPASIDDQILPGISLTFTDNFTAGDEAVVNKHDEKKAIGQENGGANKVELSLKLRSADDKLLERITSRVFFLFTDQTSLMELTNQGVSLENSVSYARSYEERDGNSEKWLVNTFRLIVHHTWRYLIPYVSDLNSVNITTGIIESSSDTGAPTFRDLVVSSTPDNWIQSY